MALPYAVDFRGRPACPCLAEWLPVFEQLLIHEGVIRESVDIAQLIGGADASAGTHSRGGAFDIWQHDPETQRLAREMGAAAWNRGAPFSPHTHGVLNGCPHNSPARYQIDALADGYSGLGAGGRGSRDYGPGPRHLRTWREGIAWAEKEIDDMSQYADQLARIENKLDRAIKGVVNEAQRDKNERERSRNRHRRILKAVRSGEKDIEAALDELEATVVEDPQ